MKRLSLYAETQHETYGVLKALLLVWLSSLRGRDAAQLVPNRGVTSTLLIELDDFHDGLRVLLLLHLGDATFLEELLPFLGEASELTRRRVETDMSQVNGVIRCTDLWSL